MVEIIILFYFILFYFIFIYFYFIIIYFYLLFINFNIYYYLIIMQGSRNYQSAKYVEQIFRETCGRMVARNHLILFHFFTTPFQWRKLNFNI